MLSDLVFNSSPTYILRFFTCIVGILFLFSKWLYPYIDFVLLYCFIAPIGSYVLQVYPAYIKVHGDKNYGNRYVLSLFDSVSHWLPLVLSCLFYLQYYRKHNAPGMPAVCALLLVAVYVLVVDVYEVYQFVMPHILFVIGFSIALYIILVV